MKDQNFINDLNKVMQIRNDYENANVLASECYFRYNNTGISL